MNAASHTIFTNWLPDCVRLVKTKLAVCERFSIAACNFFDKVYRISKESQSTRKIKEIETKTQIQSRYDAYLASFQVCEVFVVLFESHQFLH